MNDVASFIAKIMADIKDFERDIKKAQAMASGLDDKDVVMEIKASINDFRRSMLQVQALSRAMEADDIEKKVKLKYDRNMFRVLHRGIENFNNELDALATDIRSFGTVFANVIKGGLVSNISALVPLTAGATSAVMALGNAVGVLGGMVIGLAGAGSIGFGGIVAYGGMVTDVLNRVKDGTVKAKAEAEAYTQSLNGLKSAWSSFIDGNEATILTTMKNALDGLKVGFQSLTPFLDGVVKSMERASLSFKDFLSNSPVASKFFDMMNTLGVRVFNDLVDGVGQLGEAFISLATQFAPLTEFVSQGFSNMMTSFNNFIQSVEGQQAIQNFTEYVMTNLPVIGQIFGDIFTGIFNLFKAFAPNSQLVFDGLAKLTEKFRTWSETVAQSDGFQKFVQYIQDNAGNMISLIGNIVMMVVNFGIALAPLGSLVLDITTKITGWIAKLLEVAPVTGLIIGVITTLTGIFMSLAPAILFVTNVIAPLIGWFRQTMATGGLLSSAMTALSTAFASISAPVWILIGVITALVSSFMYLWNTNEEFRTRVIEIWNQIRDHISNAVQAVKTFVMEIFGTLVDWWNENNELIMQTVSRVWNNILNIIETVMNILVPIVQTAWELIKGAIRIALDLILGIIKAGMQLINGDWKGAWETIKQTVANIWEHIKTAITNVIEILKPIILNFVTNAKQWISDKFNQAKQILIDIWNSIKSFISSKAQEILSNIKQKFNEMKTAIQTAIQAAKQIVVQKFSEMLSSARQKAQQIASNVKQKFSEIKNAIQQKIQAAKEIVVQKFSEMLSSARQKAQEIASNVKQKFSEIKNAIQEKMQAAKQALVQKFTEMVSTARNKAQEVYNTVKDKIGQIPGAVRGFMGDMVSAGGDLIRGLIDGILGMAGNAVETIKRTVGNMVGAAKRMLKIHSPSRVFRDIGGYTVGGLVKGIESNARSAVSSASNMARAVVDTANKELNDYDPQLNTITSDSDINGQISDVSNRINHSIKDDLDNGIDAKDPANINVSLGGKNYQTFSDDIRETSNRPLNLREIYSV